MNIKSKIKPIIRSSGILRLLPRFLPPSVIILCYHSVSKDRIGQSDAVAKEITVDAHLFDEHMRILRNEYHPITLDDLSDWQQRKKKLPRRAVAVTFDDGFSDNYEVAVPVMEKHAVQGAIYLAVDAVRRQELPWYCRLHYLFRKAAETAFELHDPETKRIWHCGDSAENKEAERFYARSCVTLTENDLLRQIEKIESWFGYKLDLTKRSPGMMSFEQAKELRRRGHIIGSHTLSHGIAGLMPPEQLQREIAGAHRILEQELGESVQHFSYPHSYQINPQWNEDSLEATRKIGYKTAVLTDFGIVRQNADSLLLPRVIIENHVPDQFRWKLETAFAGIKT